MQCRIALWDCFGDDFSFFICYDDVAQKITSKLVHQNGPIAQFTTLETRKGPKCVPHVFLGLLLRRTSQLMANLFT